MFNLIVKGNGWASSADTMPSGRVFEYTEDYVAEELTSGVEPDFEALGSLPTLLLEEGSSDQIAHVGTITQIRSSGREIALEYVFDPNIAPSAPTAHLIRIGTL